MTTRLFLFGVPTIEHGGRSVVLPFERRSQLLVFLAVKQSWVGRADLAALLWPEQESRLAYANLRKTVFRLQSVPWTALIETQGASLRVQAATDLASFESALGEQRLADALAARRGELLGGFEDAGNEAWTNWLGFERERLRVAWRGAALQRLAADLEPGEGIDLSARLLEADPLDEAALKAHMGWLARGGQNGRARQAYREFVERIARELGLAPGADLRALHDSLGSSMRAPVPAMPSPGRSAEDGFIGRAVERRRLAELLSRDDCRLVTITGPGGAGKTSLARRALSELAARFTDGAAFVRLEDVAAIGELGARIAHEMGIWLAGSGEPLEQVAAHLQDRQMLLVLDNFEQLSGDAGVLDRLLAKCPRLRVIVTSRSRLALAGEWLLPLEGLPCPEREDEDRIESFDAARLFLRAARRIDPTLEPAAEAASIIDICRQVEGLPLALELAAAWIRVLGCDAIAAELHQGPDLLQAVDAAQPPRHASFATVFDQSWRLLGPAERDALARLSVFRGGFAAEAARAAAGAPLPVLGALVDKSLLRKDGERLSLHPLVQQFAALRLGDGAAREAARRAHAAYFHRLLAQLRPGVENGDRAALDRVAVEFENCRAAWQWAVAQRAGTALAQSAPALTHFCDHRGNFKTGLSLLREALGAEAGTIEPGLEAALRGGEAKLLFRLDRYTEAEEAALQALAAATQRRDHPTETLCLSTLGACALRRGRVQEAARHFEQALKRALAIGHERRAAALMHNLALTQRASGRRDEALRLLFESQARSKALGDFSGEAMCLSTISALYWDSGELDTAIGHLKAGLAICERHGLDRTRMVVLANLAALSFKKRDLAAAESHAAKVVELAVAIGNRHFESWMKVVFAQLALQRADYAAARAQIKGALELALSIGHTAVLLEAIATFAELLAAQGEQVGARRILGFVAEHPAMHEPDRQEVRANLARLGAQSGNDPAWPGLELTELAQRIVVESEVAQGPLVAALRGAG